jgi:manganese oxidase
MRERGLAAGSTVWMTLTAAIAVVAIVMSSVAIGRSGDTTTAAPPGSEQVVEVELTEFAIRPATINVEAGADVVLRVTNAGVAQHDLEVVGVGATSMLDPGETEDLRLGALAAGEYRLLCTVAGHEGAGMSGTLVAGEGGGDHGGHTPGDLTAEEMDELHLAGVAAFPAETEGRGGQLLEPVMDGDVKVFELTASEFDWEVEPGVFRQAMGYNGMVPGPEIRVQLGDEVRVILHNELRHSTAIHFHGLQVPNDQDGVPGLTQPLVKPGESYTYEFTVPNSGSHMYHSHMDAAHQVPMGLLGAFVVEGPDEPEVDQDIVMILNDGPLGYTINGKGFPATEPIVAQVGETVRLRYMNEGLQIHPMHLHGPPQQMIARDGYFLAQPVMMDTVLVSPGERIDVLIEPTTPGLWAFHCHVLTHVERADGMFGMVTVLIVEE